LAGSAILINGQPLRLPVEPVIRLIALAAALVMAACGSSTPSGSSKPLFVGINKSADQQYFIDQQQAFKAEIEKKGGQVKLYNAKLDANTGISEVNDAISAGAKGIAITVPDQTIGPAVSKSAADAKVALVATDDAIKDSSGNPVPFVGFSGTDMGTKVGDEAAKLLTAAGWLTSGKKVTLFRKGGDAQFYFYGLRTGSQFRTLVVAKNRPPGPAYLAFGTAKATK